MIKRRTTLKRRPPGCVKLAQYPLVEQRFEQLFHRLPVACFCCDVSGAIVEWNQGSEHLFDRSGGEVLLRPVWKVIGRPEDAESIRALFRSVLSGEVYERVELRDHAVNGTPRCLLCSAFPLFDPNGVIIGAVCTCVDISERRRMEQETLEANRRLEEANARLAALATSDGLTGLKNHRAFQERLSVEMDRSRRHGMPLSLVLLDVDHFKQYNDAYGHQAGDAILREVAAHLEAGIRSVDMAARYGGEEFVLLLPHCASADAVVVAERCRAAIAGAAWTGRSVTASFGVATLQAAMSGPADLVAAADQALYAAKHNGRNQLVVA